MNLEMLLDKEDAKRYQELLKEDIVLPQWTMKYDEDVINTLGGKELIMLTIEKKGEQQARGVIELLADGIMAEKSNSKSR